MVKYEWKITVKKMLYQVGFAALAAGITAGINFIEQLPATGDYAVFLMLLALLKGADNYMKHKK